MSGDGEKAKKEIESLPAQEDKFWEKAETNLYKLKEISCQKGGHEFVYVRTGREAKCRKCPVGYILPIGAEIKKGHIFIKGQLVV